MRTPQKIVREIIQLTGALVARGLADDQNLPFLDGSSVSTSAVRYGGTVSPAWLLKDRPYDETYAKLRVDRDYNLRMLDGALIQMNYRFDGADVVWHRLAFFPSPDLLEYQNNPELYMEETLYSEVTERRVVTVPLRFDFDRRSEVAEPVHHPVCHLTLGQYTRCRIPVSAPVAPVVFMDFILRSFYNTAFLTVTDDLPTKRMRFGDCIHLDERSIVHIAMPTS